MENKRAGDMIQKELLEYALTLQPDIIGVGEMKSEEAFLQKKQLGQVMGCI